MRGTAKYVCFECKTYRRGVKHGVILRCRICSNKMIKVPNAAKVPSPKNIKDWKSLQEDMIERKARRYNPTTLEIELRYKSLQSEKRRKSKKTKR